MRLAWRQPAATTPSARRSSAATSRPTPASSKPTSRRRSTCRAARCARRSSGSSRTVSSSASHTGGPGCGSVTDEEAVEILQARAVLEGLAVRQAAERIDEAGARVSGVSLPPARAARAGRPPRRVRRERRAARGAARALRARHGACASSARSTRRPSVTSTARSDPRSFGRIGGGARRDRRGGHRPGKPDDAEAAMRKHLFNVAEAVRPGTAAGRHRQGEPWRSVRKRRVRVSHRSLEDLLASAESPVELLRNSQAGPNVFPACRRVHQLARRATGLAGDLRPLRPVVPHDRPRGRRPGRARAALEPRASTASTASPSTRPSTSCPARPTATSSATSSSSRSARTGSTSSAARRP